MTNSYRYEYLRMSREFSFLNPIRPWFSWPLPQTTSWVGCLEQGKLKRKKKRRGGIAEPKTYSTDGYININLFFTTSMTSSVSDSSVVYGQLRPRGNANIINITYDGSRAMECSSAFAATVLVVIVIEFSSYS